MKHVILKKVSIQDEYYTLKKQDRKQLNLRGAFYQSERIKINSSWVILVFFPFIYVAANAFKLVCVDHLAKIESFLYHSNLLL